MNCRPSPTRTATLPGGLGTREELASSSITSGHCQTKPSPPPPSSSSFLKGLLPPPPPSLPLRLRLGNATCSPGTREHGTRVSHVPSVCAPKATPDTPCPAFSSLSSLLPSFLLLSLLLLLRLLPLSLGYQAKRRTEEDDAPTGRVVAGQSTRSRTSTACPLFPTAVPPASAALRAVVPNSKSARCARTPGNTRRGPSAAPPEPTHRLLRVPPLQRGWR